MPQCPHCGTEIPEGATTCPSCGQSAGAPAPPAAPAEQPETAAGPAGIPWENPAVSLVERWIETVKRLILQPVDFFRDLPPTPGDWLKPYLFTLICAYLGGLANLIYSTIFSFGGGMMLPKQFRGFGMAASGGVIAYLFLTPIGLAIALLISTLIYHLLLTLLKASTQGLEATYRVTTYAGVTYLCGIIPFIGGLIQLVWWVVLTIIGFREVHKTTTGKAAAAVLIPILLCILCAVFAAMVIGLAVFRMAQG